LIRLILDQDVADNFQEAFEMCEQLLA
jgi:hypothetical protein